MSQSPAKNNAPGALSLIRSPLLVLTALVALSLSQPVKAEDHPLKIGFVVSLTGPLAEFGAAIRNGVTLALEEDHSLSEKMMPIFEDSQYNTSKALIALRKLNSVDGADLVYVFGGPMSEALSPVAESMKLPMFSTEYDVRYTVNRKYVFRFANNASDYASALAEELRARNVKNIGVIKEENQYHNTLSHALVGLHEQPWKSEVVFNFLPGERDFRAAIARLQKSSYDALGVYLTPPVQRSFLSQLRGIGIKVQMFGTDSFESPAQNKGLERLIEGALFANSAVSADFVSRYTKRFSSEAQLVHAALAYEWVKLLGDVFPEVPANVSADEIVKRFQIAEVRESVCGLYHFRNSPATGQYFSFPIAVREIQEGRPEIVRLIPAP